MSQTKTKRNRIPPPAPKAGAPSLSLSCIPPDVLKLVRTGNAAILPTKPLTVFYVLADSIEKAIKALKEKCRPVILSRRDEGVPTGTEGQHREFAYRTPDGDVRLTIQERIVQQPDPEKLEALLKSRDLWQSATTTTLDMEKVNGLCAAGLITAEELANVSDAPRIIYALIAKIKPPQQPLFPEPNANEAEEP